MIVERKRKYLDISNLSHHNCLPITKNHDCSTIFSPEIQKQTGHGSLELPPTLTHGRHTRILFLTVQIHENIQHGRAIHGIKRAGVDTLRPRLDGRVGLFLLAG